MKKLLLSLSILSIIFIQLNSCRTPQDTGPSIGPVFPSSNPSVSVIPG